MSDELIIRQCAPTLAGIKTGSLFPCRYESLSQLMDDVRNLNRRLVSKGLSVLPMRCENGSALLYVYRPRRLQKDLSGELAQKLLQEAGYPCGGSAICVTRLVQRLRRQKEFPHEVGGARQADVSCLQNLHGRLLPPSALRQDAGGACGGCLNKILRKEFFPMLHWLSSNLSTIVISLLLLAVISLIVRYLIRQHKQGKHSCGGSCGACGACKNCHSKS